MTTTEKLMVEVQQKDALIIQLQKDIEELHQSATQKVVQKQQLIDQLKAENIELKHELDSHIKSFQMGELKDLMNSEDDSHNLSWGDLHI